jgi:hypothetical protein
MQNLQRVNLLLERRQREDLERLAIQKKNAVPATWCGNI